MAVEPHLHLHFHMEKDFRSCWPSFFGCCNKKPVEPIADEFLLNNKMNCVPVNDVVTDVERQDTQIKVAIKTHNILKHHCKDWQCIYKQIEEISGINLSDEILENRPLTYDKIVQLSQAIDKIKENSR